MMWELGGDHCDNSIAIAVVLNRAQRYCSHTFAPLDGGKLVDGCQIQCPFHRAHFDVRTGAVLQWANFPPGIQLLNPVRNAQPLKTYRVQVRGGQVFVEI